MIPITEEDLKLIADEKGYRPEILEKVYCLLEVPFLKERFIGLFRVAFLMTQLPYFKLIYYISAMIEYVGAFPEVLINNSPKFNEAINEKIF